MRKFAFIVHLRDIQDLMYTLHLPNLLVSVLQQPILYSFSKLRGRLGFSIRPKLQIQLGEKAEGYIVLMLLTGTQVMDIRQAHRVRSRILEAILYAQNHLHCDIIGLGALTASVTQGGEWLIHRKEVRAAVTHGDAFSVYVANEGIQKIAKMTELDLNRATVAILGATGISGEALTYELAPIIKNGLILTGRNSKKLEAVKARVEELGSHPTISLDLDDIASADIVVTATSWPKAMIEARHLKEGAIIYEISQPRNVSPSILKERPDVLVIDGAYTTVPNGMNFWWGNHPKGTNFACMTETIMMTLEKDAEDHVGKVDPNYVARTGLWAKKYGFSHAPFTSFGRRVQEEEILALKRRRLRSQRDD